MIQYQITVGLPAPSPLRIYIGLWIFSETDRHKVHANDKGFHLFLCREKALFQVISSLPYLPSSAVELFELCQVEVGHWTFFGLTIWPYSHFFRDRPLEKVSGMGEIQNKTKNSCKGKLCRKNSCTESSLEKKKIHAYLTFQTFSQEKTIHTRDFAGKKKLLHVKVGAKQIHAA